MHTRIDEIADGIHRISTLVPEIGPDGFNFMPAKMEHQAWLPAGSLTFITVDAAWDVHWVEGPPTAADLTQ